MVNRVSLTVRRNPDAYIEQIAREKKTRGVLRVYLGYAAGTGKTCAMLSAAHGLLAEGVDVLVGLVETHGRAGTEVLLRGLPLLERKVVEYRGNTFAELDLDAALERRPQVLLVDELAHSNVGDSRHAKRWGDVLELLQAGIEVHTTVNVQHLESMAEVVGDLTRITVAELVPDKVLEEAEEIVLIDLPPDDLLERLEAGKVYRPEQARRAREGFFQKTHLLALRELAMRNATHHVDEDARDHLRRSSLAGPWPAGERLLVCVGPSPYSERLIRSTKRLADAMSATWVALHVDTGALSPSQQERVDRHLQLAQRMGGDVVATISHSLIEQVLETAASHNVTKVVTGRTPNGGPLKTIFRPSLADQVLRRAPSLDVLVLAGGEEPSRPAQPVSRRFSPKPYLSSAALVTVATLVGLGTAGHFNLTVQLMIYMVAVIASAYLHGGAASTVSSLLAVVAFNFFFVPPRFTFSVAEPSYWLTFFGLLFNGHLISRLTASAREQANSARRREDEALTLLALSRDLAGASSQEALTEVARRHIETLFGPCVLLLQNSGGRLLSVQPSPLDPSEVAVADRCVRTATPTGKGTDILPGASLQWFPLKGPTRVLGAAGLSQPVALGARRREDLLEAILNQVSAALERRALAETANQAELLQASEDLHKALLRSVSHDLRIPLVAIQGTLSSLQEIPLSDATQGRQAMIANALGEAQRLDRLVGNLLQKTRLETGHLSVRRLPCDVEDLISTTVAALRYRLEGRAVQVSVPTQLPLVPMDFVLIGQVLTNLLENAMAYSPQDSPIEVQAWIRDRDLVMEVRDRGNGLGEDDPERLFGAFERGSSTRAPGTGLGLSICRGLVEAHQGRIQAMPRPGGGAAFIFTLPLEVPHGHGA